ncbi:OmpA family protein [Vibrio sp. SCSIO 43135]|uniref:OmpA family protein n=1 Tax=Vibrio sp. SCSIO 43135 TaxID=2819096 RepID=UPI002075C97B|nr:OmpA family protein [Vibrio sp. SCSIO 43135]USD40051.1 OmpA family protein [Vibrio sp. SCSIO 43135]
MDTTSGVLIMKTATISTLTLLVAGFAMSGCANDDYPYIDTPQAKQISDLLDDDRDGVVNARDICPGTPKGSSVDNDGCGETIRSEDTRQLRILFAHNSYEINPVFGSQIQTMADFLKVYKSASIEIQGYASKVGAPEYNLELSKKRAHTVEDKLLSYEIDPKRVRVVGYGETRLETDGDDPASHAANRKVTATVVGLKEEVVEEWNIFTTLEK